MNYLQAILFACLAFIPNTAVGQKKSLNRLTVVELNCENLFDCRHDSAKNDYAFLPNGEMHWTRTRMWRKLNYIGHSIIGGTESLPDLIALCEVENDSVMHFMTRRSYLAPAKYEYFITSSPDERGLDVALIYDKFHFKPLCYDFINIPLLRHMRPTRDILYVKGLHITGDTLHVFVLHSPSRRGGEYITRNYRMHVANILTDATDRILHNNPDAYIIVAGDFNDPADSPALRHLAQHQLFDVTSAARGIENNTSGNYYFQGQWQFLDHILVSNPLLYKIDSRAVIDFKEMLEPAGRPGEYKPKRTYKGTFYQRGYSDHLPLIVHFDL